MRALGLLAVAPLMVVGLAASPALSASAAATPYHAALNAENEKTPPTNQAGPTGGTGTATVTIDLASSQLCYDLTWANIDTPNAAHIHRGPANTSGPIVVILEPTSQHRCLNVAGPVLQGIASDPSGYYVNIHTQSYPNGAVRGQLQSG